MRKISTQQSYTSKNFLFFIKFTLFNTTTTKIKLNSLSFQLIFLWFHFLFFSFYLKFFTFFMPRKLNIKKSKYNFDFMFHIISRSLSLILFEIRSSFLNKIFFLYKNKKIKKNVSKRTNETNKQKLSFSSHIIYTEHLGKLCSAFRMTNRPLWYWSSSP